MLIGHIGLTNSSVSSSFIYLRVRLVQRREGEGRKFNRVEGREGDAF